MPYFFTGLGLPLLLFFRGQILILSSRHHSPRVLVKMLAGVLGAGAGTGTAMASSIFQGQAT